MLSFLKGSPFTTGEATAESRPSPVATLPAMEPIDEQLPSPPAADDPVAKSVRQWLGIYDGDPRPGDLTERWSVAFGTGWLLVAVSFVAVWVSSRTTGFSTWWLGPESAPRFVVLSSLPIMASLTLAGAAYSRTRWLPFTGSVVALALGGLAAGDIGRVNGYALVEATIAASALLISVASFAGMYRRTRNAQPND